MRFIDRHLVTPAAGVMLLGALACSPLAGCGGGSSSDVAPPDDTGADDTGLDDTSGDSTPPLDTGTDTGVLDTSSDTGASDTGVSDTGASDTGAGDTGTSDTGAGDTTASDTGAGDVGIDVGLDVGTDSGPTCTPGSACTTAAGGQGICQSDGVSCGCTDVTDDAACKTLYGGASSSPYLCLSGTCAPGNCRADTDCGGVTKNPTCGFSTPNFCGGCAGDGDCSSRSSATPICTVATGLCVSAACVPAATGKSISCVSNPADICCGAAVTGTCASGNCCVDSDCAATGVTCKRPSGTGSGAGICTSCSLPTGNTFYVDPVGGNDSTGVGSGSTGGGCAFRTITRALQVIGATPPVGTKVVIVGGTSTAVNLNTDAATGEKFPITVTAGVTITASGLVTAAIPAGKIGFALFAANSGLNGFAIDGQSNTALGAIYVPSGDAATTIIHDLTITNFAREAIVVYKTGALFIGPGVAVSGSGTTAPTATSVHYSGLHITGTGKVIINVPAGSATTSFHDNSAHGIQVDGQASVTITGTPGSADDSGTVTSNHNYFAGLLVSQTPKAAAALPLNSVNGFVAFGTTSGNGIRVTGGSQVKIRNSVILGTAANGIAITASGAKATRNNDVSGIDLGKAGDFGKNKVQDLFGVAGHSPNQGSGICLAIDPVATGGAPQTLAAEGNVFAGPKDCSTTAAVLVRSAVCGGHSDVSSAATTNVVDVATCTAP